MSSQELKNKPLVEAIFEMRWALQQKGLGVAADPHYRLLLGRLYDRLQTEYPEHQQLDTANIPDEMAGHVVQHRFRVAEDDWPLVQLGPGIFTVNDTGKYRWSDYRARVIDAQKKLYDAHPKSGELKIENLTLRYINAVEFDHQSSSVLDFLNEKMKVSISLPQSLFENTDVDLLPQHFQTHQMYHSKKPLGIVQISFATGQRDGKSALLWETMCQSAGDDLPKMPEEFETWLDQSHTLVKNWFFKLIDGDLHRRFSGE